MFRRVVMGVCVLLLAAGVLSFALSGSSSPTSGGPVIHLQRASSHFVAHGLVGAPPPGSPAVGDILTTTNGQWSGSPTGFTYLWEDCDSAGANCTTAAGSPTNTNRYVIVSGDTGFTIRVKVTASYSGHPDASVQSQPIGIVGGGSGGSLPTGVTLQAIDGGTCSTSTGPCSDNYYCSNGFTNACNAGWDNLSYFPLTQDYYYCSEPVSQWTGVGLNGATRFNNDCSPSTFGTTMSSNGLSAIPGQDQYTTSGGGTATSGFGSETVGWHIEEPQSWSNITTASNDYAGYTTGGVSGRFLQISLTANEFPNGFSNLLNSGWNSSCGTATIQHAMTCTVNMPSSRHMDVVSADNYWFANAGLGGNVAQFRAGNCGALYGGINCTSDQTRRGSNYGDQVDDERSWVSGTKPVGVYVETYDGNQANLTPGPCHITPPELNWADWDSIVHGVRMINYFYLGSAPTTAGFPTATSDASWCTSYSGVSVYTQATSTNGLIEDAASIINSPFALGFAANNAGGYVFPTADYGSSGDLTNGLDISTHYYTGGGYTKGGITFGNGFYILASVRGSDSQTMPKTYTFTLPSTDTTPTGSIQDVCACAPTQSTGSVSYSSSTHQFSETFSAVTDTHIIGPFQ